MDNTFEEKSQYLESTEISKEVRDTPESQKALEGKDFVSHEKKIDQEFQAEQNISEQLCQNSKSLSEKIDKIGTGSPEKDEDQVKINSLKSLEQETDKKQKVKEQNISLVEKEKAQSKEEKGAVGENESLMIEELKERLNQLFENYGFDDQDDVSDATTLFFSGELDEIYLYVKKKKRDEFKEKLELLFQIFQQNQEKKEKGTFEEEIQKCFVEFEIYSDDQEECLELIMKKDENYVKKAKKKRREDFKRKVDEILVKYEKQKTSTFEQEIKNCFVEFQIDSDDQEECLQLIMKKDEKYVKIVQKKKREPFKKKVDQILNKYPPENKEKQITFEEQIMNCIVEFQIDSDNQEQCLEMIKNKDTNYSIKAKKKKRKQFKNRISEIIQKYEKEQKQETYQSQIMNCLAEFQIQEDDIKECLDLLEKNDQNYVLLAKKKKRQNFKQRVSQILKKHEKFVKIIKKIHLTVSFEDNIYPFEGENDEIWLNNLLKTRFAIQNQKDYIFILNESIVENINAIFEEKKSQILLKIEKKVELFYEFHQKIQNIKTSKNATHLQIKQQVLSSINEKIQDENYQLTLEQVEVMYQFQKGNQQQFENLKKSQLLHGELKQILVEQKIKVNIYYHGNLKQICMKSYNNFRELQEKMSEIFFPKEAQKIELNKESLNEKHQNVKLFKFLDKENSITLSLSNSHTKQYYGFHSNYTLNYKDFSLFQIESEAQILKNIENSDLRDQSLEKPFFDAFIRSLFLSVKKRFPIQTILDKFKELVAKNKYQKIWIPAEENKPIKMNEYFVLQYLLYNSDARLQIQLMNLVRSMLPLPLYFKKFQNILDIKDEFNLNEQLIWVLKQGITICSIGLHKKQNLSTQKGKTSLLNQLFFTNFPLHQIKHKIIEDIPFISVRVYDDLFPLNIIDIPSGCKKQYRDKLISCCNIFIIHSWRTAEQSIKKQTEIQKKMKKKAILLLRDINENQADQLKVLNETQLNKNPMIKVPNLSNKKLWKSFFDIFREKMNLYLKEYKSSREENYECYSLFQSKEFLSFNNHLNELQKENSELCKFIEKGQILDNTVNQREIKKIVDQGMNKKIKKIIDFIEDSKLNKEISLMYFRQKIRTIQNQKTAKYMRIYKIKQKVKKLQEQDQQFQKQIEAIHKNLLNLPELYQKGDYLTFKSKSSILKIFQKITFDFENKIKPKIFSIELFWREIHSFYQYQKAIRSPETIFQTLTDLKSCQILNSQPFQIIDGDALQMPREVMKEVFKPLNERCLVLTILGPQSSGKSTLLNFLFGCDFATSQGRCTRGVYGTFFKFNDQRINFDGIFVIDTEGLFAVTNEKDAKKEDRDDFDSKLVLFCLAVSDFVIINVRGNLDHNTQKILRICYDKLEELRLPEEERPEIVIVLNQNNTSKTDESEHEFKKIRKTLNFNIARSLSLAYQIKNYTHKDISLLAENEVLTKKIPSSHFLEETSELLEAIMNKMKTKKTAEKIYDKIDKFSQIWSTVLEFPHLSKLTSKQYNQLQLQIKYWKKVEDEEFNKKYNEILSDATDERIDDKTAIGKIEDLNHEYLERYCNKYQADRYQSDLKILIEQEKKQIMLKNQNNETKIRYNLTELNLKKQLNKEKFEGDRIIRQMERQIIKNQSNGLHEYSQEEKMNIFNEGFDKALEKIKKSLTLDDKKMNEFQRILSEYNLLLKSNKFSVQGLPKIENQMRQKEITKPQKEFIEIILNNILYSKIDSENLMRYLNRPYTNILKESKTDAKLKYFNVKEYFYENKKTQLFYLKKKKLLSTINYSKIGSLVKKYLNEKYKQAQYERLQIIFKNINDYLTSNYGIQMLHFSEFEKKFKEEAEKSYSDRIASVFSFLASESHRYHSSYKLTIDISNRKKQEKFESQFIDLSRSDVFREKNTRHLKNFVEDKLSEKIKWKKIKYTLDQQKIVNSESDFEGDREILKKLNSDLNKINLYLQNECKIISLFKKKSKWFSFQDFEDNVLPHINERKGRNQIDNYENFAIKFHELQYFDGWQLKKVIKSTIQKTHQQQFVIAELNTVQLKEKKSQFKGYIQNDRKIGGTFKSQKFRKFVFDELQNNGKLKLLFQEVLKIINEAREKWKKLGYKAITEIYNRINEEITLFNNDLNQVSHILTSIFIGKVHLLATYVIWKYEIDRIQEKQNEPYEEKVKQREIELERFLSRTSNNLDKIMNEEAEVFIEQIGKAFGKYTDNEKAKQFNYWKDDFIFNYDRKNLQRDIDIDIFSDKTNKTRILDYLETPSDVIEAKYEEIYEQIWDYKVKYNYEKKKTALTFFKDVMNLLRQFDSNLENVDKIVEGKGGPSDIFQMVGNQKPNESKDYEQQAKYILFKYFLGHILSENKKTVWDCYDIKLAAKSDLAKLSFPETETVEVFLQMKKQMNNLKITDLPKFIKKLLLEKNERTLQKILIEAAQMSEEEKQDFINSIRVVICKQKCPCCGRICGVEENHTFHKCLYGHQMRALAGNYINKKDDKKEAFVVRCEQLKESDIMEYNGKKMTWTEFKDYWAKKPTGGWLYDDANDSLYPQNKKRFENAWLLAGPDYCLQKGIQYVDYNSAESQLHINEKVHFIFALDESGSMGGTRWSQLMSAFSETLLKIKTHAGSAGNMFASVINFAGNYRIIYEREDVMNIDPSRIQYGSGGTSFEPVFQAAYNIAQKTIQNQIILFIFMTDGDASYPSSGVSQFQQMMKQYPKRFIYSGIEFNCSSSVMKNIESALQGRNHVANNLQELLGAYESAIEIIAYKQHTQ